MGHKSANTTKNWAFTNGTWAVQNDDEELVLDFEDNAADGTYQIRRLTESQLWLHKVGDDLELHLKSQ